ncbi:MAG TPA: hypothetical protein VFS87_10695 [Qipengyuania sp.]|nr:hypothetical protein [Qipengyuania sp.]
MEEGQRFGRMAMLIARPIRVAIALGQGRGDLSAVVLVERRDVADVLVGVGVVFVRCLLLRRERRAKRSGCCQSNAGGGNQ